MVSLDYFFLTSAILSVLACMLIHTTNRRWVRMVALFILFITLINMVNYRKNAILIAPIFFIFAIHSLPILNYSDCVHCIFYTLRP